MAREKEPKAAPERIETAQPAAESGEAKAKKSQPSFSAFKRRRSEPGAETEAAETEEYAEYDDESEAGENRGLFRRFQEWRHRHKDDGDTDKKADKAEDEENSGEAAETLDTAELPVDKSGNRVLFRYALFFFLSVFLGESVLKIYVYGSFFNRGLLLMTLFSAAYAFFCAVAVALFKNWLSRVIGFILLFFTMGWLMLQTVYYTVFSTFFTLYSFSGAGDIIEFWQAALGGIVHALLPLLFMVLPFIVFFVCRRFFKITSRPAIWVYAIALVLVAGFQVGGTAVIYQCDDDVMSEKYLYTKTFIPQLSVDDFGAVTTLRLDMKNMIFGMEDTATAAAFEKQEAAAKNKTNYADNVMEIDFAALAETDTDAILKEMDSYFATVTPTAQNEYTGMFQGKNLIWIVAEGFSSWAIDKNLTPTLYQLSKECFVFKNYYNPIWGVSTSDGEYTVCTGLLPKAGVWSMSTSGKNDMPFCMGNQLTAAGYLCNAYHNHSYTYYDRDTSHPNMGYNFIAKGHGMKITTQWPESDLEMMQNTLGDYSMTSPFHAYYMTVSGHLEYNFGGNAMAAKHKDEVADLPYTDAGKAYIACQMEFDQSLAYLIENLKAAGTLDDTLIVISGDHYPYGLTDKEIDDLNGGEVEKNFELYHSILIMWNSAMAAAEPVVIDKPCYSVDILPTLSNLMGVEYDSRLLMGRDIFSTSSPLVVFANHSWLTDKGRYNAVSGEFTPADGVTVKESYSRDMMEKVNAMFSYSAKILETNYYAHVVP